MCSPLVVILWDSYISREDIIRVDSNEAVKANETMKNTAFAHFNMYSKNVHRSSEIVFTGDFLKMKKSKETAVQRSGLLSPKLTIATNKHKQSEASTKHSQRVLLEKVRSLSPRNEQPVQAARSTRVVKSKSKKDESFEKWKNDYIRSFHERNQSGNFKRHAAPLLKSTRAAKPCESLDHSLNHECEYILKRAHTLLQSYMDKIRSMREINRGLVYENCTLKSRLAKH